MSTLPLLTGTELMENHSDLHNEERTQVNTNTTDIAALDTDLTSGSNPGHTHTLAAGATDVTASAAEVNVLDGITSSTAELNILDGVTASATEINVLDGIPATLTATELGYVDGVTSAIQTQLDAKAPTASPSFTGDVGLATNGNIQVNGADPYKTVTIPAGSMRPTTTSGCASSTTIEAGTNDVDYVVLDFDQTTSENAFFHYDMPNCWDGGTIFASFTWTAASGSGTVTWSLKGRAYADDDAIDQAYGTAQSVTDTLLTAGDIHISSETSAITLGGTPAGGQWCQFKVTRDTADTLNADARLIGIKIRYKLAKYSD